MTAPRRSPSPLRVAAVLGLLTLGVIGASIAVGGFPATAPSAAPLVEQSGDAIRWRTDVVELAAREFWIEANGLRFVGVASPRLSSDPGSLSYWTLEVSWAERGREQRLNLYFAADAASWWINEVRVYDGAGGGKADWARFPPGPLARTPRGRVFEGDLDLAGTAATGPVRLRLGGVRIGVHPDDHVTAPLGGGITLGGDEANPFRAGAPLHCSGILQLPPRAAEAQLLSLGYRLSWRWEYSTGGNNGFSEIRDRAPEIGFISDTAVGESGELIVFVEDPTRPMMEPAIFPPACPLD